jgi:hypothetical protein
MVVVVVVVFPPVLPDTPALAPVEPLNSDPPGSPTAPPLPGCVDPPPPVSPGVLEPPPGPVVGEPGVVVGERGVVVGDFDVVVGGVVGGTVVEDDPFVTVNVCGVYVVVSDGRPLVKQAATTRPASGSVFAGTVNVPCQEPSAATGICVDSGSVVELIST